MTEPENFQAGIDAVIARALSENRIVGTVVLIARDGELVYQRAAGFADREAGKHMGVDTLFRLASVTKAIVCAAVMALVERDELSLESRVDRWLPEFRPKLPSGDSPAIAIRHLLTHCRPRLSFSAASGWPVCSSECLRQLRSARVVLAG